MTSPLHTDKLWLGSGPPFPPLRKVMDQLGGNAKQAYVAPGQERFIYKAVPYHNELKLASVGHTV